MSAATTTATIPLPALASRRAAQGTRGFRLLLAALATSSIGDWLYNVALLALVSQRGGAGWLGVVTAARVAPIVLLGPLGGVLADRCNRRALMLASDLVRGLLMLALAVVGAADLPLWLAPVLATLATAAGSAHPACVSVTTPRLVPEAYLGRANAARSAVGQAAIVIGPAVGALVLALASPAAAFLANAATFAVSAAVTAAIRGDRDAFAPVSREQTGRASVLRDLSEGARALRAAPDALRMVWADVACSAVYGAQTVLLVMVAVRVGHSAATYGILLGAFGVGGLIGATLAGRVDAQWRRALGCALLAVSVPLPLLGLVTSLPAAIALAVLGGAGGVVGEVLSETAVQRLLPEAVLGRAFGLVIPVSIGGISGSSAR
jgi:MFS family permease